MSKRSVARRAQPKVVPVTSQREVACARLRESGEQLAATVPTYPDLTDGYEAGHFSKHPEEYCNGCDRMLPQFLDGREVRGVRVYCMDCANRSLPTHAEMLAVVSRAFDVVAAEDRRLGHTDREEWWLPTPSKRPRDAALADFNSDVWENLAAVWKYLAYRPVKVA